MGRRSRSRLRIDGGNKTKAGLGLGGTAPYPMSDREYISPHQIYSLTNLNGPPGATNPTNVCNHFNTEPSSLAFDSSAVHCFFSASSSLFKIFFSNERFNPLGCRTFGQSTSMSQKIWLVKVWRRWKAVVEV